MEQEPSDTYDFIEISRIQGNGADSMEIITVENNDHTVNGYHKKESLSDQDLSNLRCSSLQIEELQKQRNRIRQPSAGYPGLAFGSPMYSNTLFKFSIIANEIKDLKQNQLKKVRIDVLKNSILSNILMPKRQQLQMTFRNDIW